MTRACRFPPDGLHRWVAEELRTAIASGQLQPGDRLVEMGLARKYQVSQGPIREALRLLEREGLVTHQPRRGVYVTRLSAQDWACSHDRCLFWGDHRPGLGQMKGT